MAEQVIACKNLEQWTEQLDKGKQSNKVIVVDFTASWCGPCRFIAPIFQELAKKFTNLIFLKVDVDELQPVAQEWSVEAMPTFILIKDGKEAKRIVGARKEELQAVVAEHAAATATA